MLGLIFSWQWFINIWKFCYNPVFAPLYVSEWSSSEHLKTYECLLFKRIHGGAWVAQSVQRLTLDLSWGFDLRVMSSSPALGSTLSMEATLNKKKEPMVSPFSWIKSTCNTKKVNFSFKLHFCYFLTWEYIFNCSLTYGTLFSFSFFFFWLIAPLFQFL